MGAPKQNLRGGGGSSRFHPCDDCNLDTYDVVNNTTVGAKMILTKLQEALAEVDSQRVALNEVEAQLRSMISKLSGMPVIASRPASITIPIAESDRGRDKLDDIADILRSEGKPLHITIIAERLSTINGETVDRTEIEPGLNRHVSKTKRKRIDKFGPSIYGLPEWKSRQSTLPETA